MSGSDADRWRIALENCAADLARAGYASSTIERTLNSQVVPQVPPEPVERLAPVIGLDGKTYTRPEPQPASAPRRRPWPEAADEAAARLDKVVTTIKGLAP